MNRTILGALVFLSIAPAVARAATAGKVGYVELARVLRDSSAAKGARDQLQKAVQAKQAAVDLEKAKVDVLKAELDKAAPTLSEVQKNARAKEILDRQTALQKMVVDARKEVGDADQASTKVVVDRMKAVLDKVAKAKGYDLVVEKSAASVLFARDGIDLTDDVIKAMDAQK